MRGCELHLHGCGDHRTALYAGYSGTPSTRNTRIMVNTLFGSCKVVMAGAESRNAPLPVSEDWGRATNSLPGAEPACDDSKKIVCIKALSTPTCSYGFTPVLFSFDDEMPLWH